MMTPQQCTTGRLVEYEPSPGHKFVGRIAGAPRQLGEGRGWVVTLDHMECPYALHTDRSIALGQYVKAAALGQLTPVVPDDLDLLRDLLAWLEAEEGRTLTLFPGKADFDDGPDHLIEYSTGYGEARQAWGESRRECFAEILRKTRGHRGPQTPTPGETMREYVPTQHQREQIEQAFVYHSPFGDQPERYQALRAKAKELAELAVKHCPPSRELSLALTYLETSVMFANASIARHERPAEVAPAESEST